MLERVLKRLCPCYYRRSTEDSELSVGPTLANKDSDLKGTSGSNVKSGSGTILDNWKGSLNLVQPQPIYAFPIDSRKLKKRNKKALLKPPLYWKKTMKNLCSEGPPVFQQLKRKKNVTEKEKDEKKKGRSKLATLKQSDMGIRSATSEPSRNSLVNFNWLKSPSPMNLTKIPTEKSAEPKTSFSLSNQTETTSLNSQKYDTCSRDQNCMKCQVLPDVSHGVILFTAAFFNRKRMCMINVNRLENLSKKGREGNSYYTVIKLAVLPSEKYIKSSKILSNCANPEVKQDFTFSVRELPGKVLRLSVFDASLQKQHEAIGHALLTLEDIVSDQPRKYRIKLYGRTQPHICPGNLSLSLKYSSEEDKFTITVQRGRNLALQRDKNVKLNTYVKATMYAYGEKIKTKKSIVVFNSRDPYYNSTFTFPIRNDQIDHVSMSISVRLKGFVSDVTIGRLNFGPFFYLDNQRLSPWGEVFLKNETVSHWYRMYL